MFRLLRRDGYRSFVRLLLAARSPENRFSGCLMAFSAIFENCLVALFALQDNLRFGAVRPPAQP